MQQSFNFCLKETTSTPTHTPTHTYTHLNSHANTRARTNTHIFKIQHCIKRYAYITKIINILELLFMISYLWRQCYSRSVFCCSFHLPLLFI